MPDGLVDFLLRHCLGWLRQQRLTGINLGHDLAPVDIYFAEKRNDFEIPYSLRLAEQKKMQKAPADCSTEANSNPIQQIKDQSYERTANL